MNAQDSKALPASRDGRACSSRESLLRTGRYGAFACAAVLLLLFGGTDRTRAANDGKPAHAAVKGNKASSAKEGKSGKAGSVDRSYAGAPDPANPAAAAGSNAGADVNSGAAEKSKSGASEASKPNAADGSLPAPVDRGNAGVLEGKPSGVEVGKSDANDAGRSGANGVNTPNAGDVEKTGATEGTKPGPTEAAKPTVEESKAGPEGSKALSKDTKPADNPAKSADTGGLGPFPISKAACSSMEAQHVINPGMPVGCARLSLVRFAYVDFEGRHHNDGEIVVMDAVAAHVYRIFETLNQKGFPIKKARLMDQYGGNDDASMADNNTSGFNGRKITGGSSISMHAYGLAIDINPVQNPFVKRVGDKLAFSPPGGVSYANRFGDRPNKKNFPGMAETVIDVFANEGFTTWGGYWDDPIDYQHFQVSPGLAERLVSLPTAQATTFFDKLVERYRTCLGHDPSRESRLKCLAAADLGPYSSIRAQESDGSPIRMRGDSQPGTNSRSSLL